MYFSLCCRPWIMETENKSEQYLSAALEAPSCCTGAFMYSHVDLGIHLDRRHELKISCDLKISIWKMWCGLFPFGSIWQYTDRSFLIGIFKSKIKFQKPEVLLPNALWEKPRKARTCSSDWFQFTVTYKSLQFDVEASPQSIQPPPPEGSRSCRIHLKQAQKIPHQRPFIMVSW